MAFLKVQRSQGRWMNQCHNDYIVCEYNSNFSY